MAFIRDLQYIKNVIPLLNLRLFRMFNIFKETNFLNRLHSLCTYSIGSNKKIVIIVNNIECK